MKKTEMITQWLSNEGYKYEVASDGDVTFKYQGAHLWCPADEDDPSFLRIVMPGIYEIQGDEQKCLRALSDMCFDRKVVKGFIYDGGVHLSVELLIDTSPELEDFFGRLCDMLVEARVYMMQKIRG